MKLFQYRSPDSTRFPVTFPPFNTSSVVLSFANDKHREVWSRGHLITRVSLMPLASADRNRPADTFRHSVHTQVPQGNFYRKTSFRELLSLLNLYAQLSHPQLCLEMLSNNMNRGFLFH